MFLRKVEASAQPERPGLQTNINHKLHQTPAFSFSLVTLYIQNVSPLFQISTKSLKFKQITKSYINVLNC